MHQRFTPAFGDSVIGTMDVEKWKHDRSRLNLGFLPLTALSEVFPISVKRSEVARKRLRLLCGGGESLINIHDFLMHEAQAQLQLALFGMSEEFMERTNAPLRAAYASDPSRGKGFMSNYLAELWVSMCVYVRSLAGP